MLKPPFVLETSLTPEDYQKVGELAIRWAHVEHMVGNCLKAMLRLSDEEATFIVFPLSLDHRLQRMRDLSLVQNHQAATIKALLKSKQ